MSLFQQTNRLSCSTRSILTVQKRFSRREEIHRYVEPNKFKKHMLAATEPYYPRTYSLPEERCKGTPQNDHSLLPIEKIYLEELLDELKTSDYSLIIQYNFTNYQLDRVWRNTLTKSGGKFLTYNNNIYKEAFKLLGHESDIHLFVTKNALVTGKIESLPKCVTALKRMPSFVLLAGFIDNHLHTCDMLTAISLTDSLDTSRAHLVTTLDTPAVELASAIERYGESLPKDEHKKNETD